MLRNSDMMVYVLQLKQKSTADVFCEILEQLLSRIILGGCFWKENRRRERGEVTLVVSGFYFFQGMYLLSHETIVFIRFYKLRKELSSATITIKVLVAETFGLGRQLKYCLVIFHV